MNDKITVTRAYKDSNNKEIKVNLTFNKIKQETAKIFVFEVEEWYNNTVKKDIKKVG